jgi:hypothetical protein
MKNVILVLLMSGIYGMNSWEDLGAYICELSLICMITNIREYWQKY